MTFSPANTSFVLASTALSTLYAFSQFQLNETYSDLVVIPITGLIIGYLIVTLNKFITTFNIKSLLTGLAGMILGCFVSSMVLPIVQIVTGNNQSELATLSQLSLALFLIYFCTSNLIKATANVSLELPFLSTSKLEKRLLLIDDQSLQDIRLLDLAISGLLDAQLIFPNCILKELHEFSQSQDEALKAKGKRGLEVLKKMEHLQDIHLQYTDLDFPEITERNSKFLAIACQLDANILTSDVSSAPRLTTNGVKVLNLNTLFSTPKIQAQTGEYLNIKIQRYGKEPRQGIGYLEDGTMVVVNGGAEFLGEGIRAQVLSVKQTFSGRMIFCNAAEEGSIANQNENEDDQALVSVGTHYDNSANNYFSL